MHDDRWGCSMDRPKPYFMNNREWYILPEDEGLDGFFEDGLGYHIRDDAPEEAKRSYEEFCNEPVYELPSIDELIEGQE